MPALLLILAHLISDFLLQPASLIKWKAKSIFGVLVHALIILLVSLAFVFPYLKFSLTWLLILALAFSHFLIDQSKIWYEKKTKNEGWTPFLIDQLLHLLVIFLVSFYLRRLGWF